MAEKDTIFSSKIKYQGIFSFKDFYAFCYDWLTEETNLEIAEDKYSEKISGESKNIDIEWTGIRKLTDYFKFEAKIKFKVIGLAEVEIQEGSTKIKTNKGSVQIDIKGILVRDYEGKFEHTAGKKFLRSIYEKWVIPSRIIEYENKIAGDCDEFLNQAKAYLDLEGKK
ncbi:hypothetical protein KAT24_02230 [Candidatus Pacearchaeota archaeon]|nr:hypothetical protein [Candidatus Pacearchaeota archaeon]